MDLGLTDQTTKSGRPLDELNAGERCVEAARRAGVSFDVAVCEYDDSRRGELMNRAALRDIASRWQQLLDALVWIYRNHYGPLPPDAMTAGRAIVLCQIGLAMPAYCFARRTNPAGPHGDLPDFVGDVYKTVNGIHAAVLRLAVKSSLQQVVTADGIYHCSDADGLYYGGDGRVCPAPKRMIDESVNALLFGSGGTRKPSELETYIPDFTELRAFAADLFGERRFALLKVASRPPGP